MNNQKFTTPKINWKFILIIIILVFVIGGGIIGYQWWEGKQLPEGEGEIGEIPSDLPAEEMFKFLPSIPHYCVFYKTSTIDDDGIRERFYETNYCQSEAFLHCYDWKDLSTSAGYLKNEQSITYYPQNFSLEKCINEVKKNPSRYALDSRTLLKSFNKNFGPNKIRIYHIKDQHTIYDVGTFEEEYYLGKLGSIVFNCENLDCFKDLFVNFTKNSSLSLGNFVPAFEKVEKELGKIDYFIHAKPSRFYKLYPVKIDTMIGCKQAQEAKYTCLSQEECKTQLGESKCGPGRPYDGCTQTQTPKYVCNFIQKCQDQNEFCFENFNKAVASLENYQWENFSLFENRSSNGVIDILFSIEPKIETRIGDLKSLSLNIGFGAVK